MKIPVIIPARNEERWIGTTLSSLDTTVSEPIVVVNDTYDRTVDIAQQFNATILESEPGKVRALQAGLIALFDAGHDFTETPVQVLDADSRPVAPSKWPITMRKVLGSQPIASGTYWTRDVQRNIIDRTMMTSLRIANIALRKYVTHETHVSGCNFILGLWQKEMLEQLLDMPDIRYRDDVAIAEELAPCEPPAVSFNPYAAVWTDSAHLPTAFDALRCGRAGMLARTGHDRMSRLGKQ